MFYLCIAPLSGAKAATLTFFGLEEAFEAELKEWDALALDDFPPSPSLIKTSKQASLSMQAGF